MANGVHAGMAENERIKALEVQMKELIGNGQPGRVTKVEDQVKANSRLLWIGMGVLWALQVLSANGFLNFRKLLGG